MATGNEPIHPAANLFPMMGDAEFGRLVEDIRENGQHEPIVYWRQQLLDGRNRLKACRELDIVPDTCELDDDAEPYRWVVSANLHRRHLTESQRALVAAKLQGVYKPAAAERQKSTLKKGADPVPVNLPGREVGETRDKVAQQLNVSPKSVSDAAAVIKHGSPELVQAVESGDVAASRAAKVARSDTPKAQQLKQAKERPAKKETTPFEHLRKWWSKADAAAQARFRLFIDGECD